MTIETTILLADDDPEITELMTLYLEKEGLEVVVTHDGDETLAEISSGDPDLVILDVMLPGPDGFEICSRIRQAGKEVPIIMLTARDEESDRVLGLELGADDYVTKPFSPRELAARVKANLRRIEPETDDDEAQWTVCGDLVIDVEARTVHRGDAKLDLTPKEFEVLATLVRNQGRVFTREQLLSSVWGYDYYGGERTVDTHIKRLRQKLGDPYREAIATVWGVGYKFESNA